MEQLLVNLYWITLLAVIVSSASGVLKAGKVAKPAASIIKKSFCGMTKILAVVNIKIALKSDAIKNT
jgi:hypothetical protein